MRKIWPSEANCSRLCENFAFHKSSNFCMPYWIRDQEGRLVRIENPQDTELDICVNIMDPPPEDQNSQQGQGGNPNAYLSMRDRMHPPRMSPILCPSTNFPWNGEYMEAINACPHHGFDTWLLVSRGWDEPNSREDGMSPTQERKEVSSQPTQNPKGGMYVLSEDMDMKAKVATIARRLEELELKKMQEVQAISRPKPMPCHAPFANHVIMW
ncbi:hypothetical protein AAG906_039808 [Vitis piasezkii]